MESGSISRPSRARPCTQGRERCWPTAQPTFMQYGDIDTQFAHPGFHFRFIATLPGGVGPAGWKLRLREAAQLYSWKRGRTGAWPGSLLSQLTLRAHLQPSTSWDFTWKTGFAAGEQKCDFDYNYKNNINVDRSEACWVPDTVLSLLNAGELSVKPRAPTTVLCAGPAMPWASRAGTSNRAHAHSPKLA